MKFRSNQASATRTPATQNPATQNSAAPAQTSSYAPSVPIPIYRELAAELDATRAILETVHTENQQLKQQNQQLRQEIDRLVQSALNLHSYTQFSPLGTESTVASSTVPSSTVQEFEAVAAHLRGSSVSTQTDLQSPETVITSTQMADLPQSPVSATKPRNLGGIWLTLTVIAVVIGAFGAGFLMVKPLLQHR